jgi:hypothetical protein
MYWRLAWIVAVSMGLANFAPYTAALAQDRHRGADALLDLLVFGPDGDEIASAAASLPADARASLDALRTRLKRFHTRLPQPIGRPSDERMVYDAHVRYEQKLAAVSADPRAPALAAAYVRALRPCYEWEGGSECPEREAQFADRYMARHPDGPFAAYLPLLAAHRWICTAEAYDYEQSPRRAAGARQRYQARLKRARRSPDPLVKVAADALAARAGCFGPQ